MTFNQVKSTVEVHVNKMLSTFTRLYAVNLDKDALWNLYLDSFPPGTNNIVKSRREHDCQHCKQYIRAIGNVVGITGDNTLVSVWDVAHSDEVYGPVFKALSNFVKSHVIENMFLTNLPFVGMDFNMAQDENKRPVKWQHFYAKIEAPHRNTSSKSSETVMSLERTNKEVLKRSLDTIAPDALSAIIELIKQDSIYRGGEWLSVLQNFEVIMKKYMKLPENLHDNFCWRTAAESGPVVSKIRNHSIGVLLVNVSEGMELDEAVRKYEAIVAPTNYQRPKPIYTKKMLQDAKDTVDRLGFTRSLHRRFANIDDITVNNVIFADRNSLKRMSGNDVFGELEEAIPMNPKTFDRATEITIEKFINDVLPTATKVELLLEGRHRSNIVSLIAPVHSDSKPMFKWGNNFSWAYIGNITDSMKERVKEAGGKVDGVLRFSIQWNEHDDNKNDYDAHCLEPNGNHIYYPNKGSAHHSSGMLDVDIVHPSSQAAVENIIYTDVKKMPVGVYTFYVNTFSDRGGRNGFRAQIEFDGQIFEYNFSNPGSRDTQVAKVVLTKDGEFTLLGNTQGNVSSSNICGLKTNSLQPVTVCMLSPNFWDGKTVGNKHYMFMLQGCQNDECPNGFFNEFLQQELVEHKRVFAALGDKMKVEPVENQLSGLGFSSTKRDHILVKVEGHSTRMLKVVI